MPVSTETLKPAQFHVLLALAERPLHGYALAQCIATESEGRVRMLPGNLYAVIHRLVESGLVAETDERPDGDDVDARRRYFTLSRAGRALLAAEASRLARTSALLASRLRSNAVDGEATP